MEGGNKLMGLKKNSKIIFYLEKNGGLLYLNKSADPIIVAFPKDTVRNLEVQNSDKLHEIISNTIAENKIKPSSVMLILGEGVVFEQNISESSNTSEDIQAFLDIVPFSSLISETFFIKNKLKAIAVSKELCEEIAAGWRKNDFEMLGIFPISAVRSMIPELKTEFEPKYVFKQADMLKAYNLLTPSKNQKVKLSSSNFLKIPNLNLGGIFG
jgi:hypothetical protein